MSVPRRFWIQPCADRISRPAVGPFDAALYGGEHQAPPPRSLASSGWTVSRKDRPGNILRSRRCGAGRGITLHYGSPFVGDLEDDQ
jgi:hypothetical protein